MRLTAIGSPVLALLLMLPALHGRANAPPEPAPKEKDKAPEAARQDFGGLERLIEGARYDRARGAYFSKLQDGREAELTLDHRLQTALEGLLVRDGISTGAVVLTEPKTGRVLAMAGRDDALPSNVFPLKAIAPAASIFKLVTAAALIESGTEPDRQVCFHGGRHRILERNLDNDPRRDNRCASLSEAVADSINLVMSKLALELLNPELLRTMAGRFFFNTMLPAFPSPQPAEALMVSHAEIPDISNRLDFGRTAAGFGNVHMSAVQGALLVGAFANDGVAVTPRFVDAVWTNGQRDAIAAAAPQRAVAQSTAQKVLPMLEQTVAQGTARKSFRRGGRPLKHIEVAGKTGSLNDHEPFRDNSWFVGFAPSKDPEVVVSALAINGTRWITRGPTLARDALVTFFQTEDPTRLHSSR